MLVAVLAVVVGIIVGFVTRNGAYGIIAASAVMVGAFISGRRRRTVWRRATQDGRRRD